MKRGSKMCRVQRERERDHPEDLSLSHLGKETLFLIKERSLGFEWSVRDVLRASERT